VVNFGGFFAKLGYFAGFSLNTINFAVYLCSSAHECVFDIHVCNTTDSLKYKRKRKRRRRIAPAGRIRRDKVRRIRREE
jgi:hypothetical protein